MLEKQLAQIRQITDFQPEIALVLGSGLGGLIQSTEVVAAVPYSDIEGLAVSTSPSHQGQFLFGFLEGKRVAVMQGRVHLYECYSAKEAVAHLRLLRKLGAEKLLITNAAGGINKSLSPGDFMLIRDHISTFVPSPLIGANDETLGTRFPDMSKAYDKELCKTIKTAASSCGIALKEGVYVQTTGPQFETPAEIKMFASLGADAVGMSTAIETIAAVHCGYRVAAISLISNLACGILDKPLSGAEVYETANRVAPQFEQLIQEIIKVI